MKKDLSDYSESELVSATREAKLTLREQIIGLERIISNDGYKKRSLITHKYISEKLQKILNGNMVFHPKLKIEILSLRENFEEIILNNLTKLENK